MNLYCASNLQYAFQVALDLSFCQTHKCLRRAFLGLRIFWPLHSMLLFMMLNSTFPVYWRILYFFMFATSSSCCPLREKGRVADGWVYGYERSRAVMRCTPSLWEMTLSVLCPSVAASWFHGKRHSGYYGGFVVVTADSYYLNHRDVTELPRVFTSFRTTLTLCVHFSHNQHSWNITFWSGKWIKVIVKGWEISLLPLVEKNKTAKKLRTPLLIML